MYTNSYKTISKTSNINLHTGHTVITIACNMKPRAGIDKGSIPALKNIIGIK